MLARRRIRVALVVLLVLALVGWFVQQAFGVGNPGPHSGSLPGAERETGPVPVCAAPGPGPWQDGWTFGTREMELPHSASPCGQHIPQHVTAVLP
ncbi:hypothetical protein FFT09_18295 [Saccharomonospora piscinae]|nr:hypothetical protein FFT09_18295 [Saccharomonospora piscinae]